MGLGITGEYENAPEYYGGYGTFFRLRSNIAKAVMKEDYSFYEKWTCTNRRTPEDEVHDLCNKLREYGHAFYKFMTASDCDGALSPNECAEIYELIKNSNEDYSFCYGDDFTIDMKDDIKILLLECCKHNARLIWG